MKVTDLFVIFLITPLLPGAEFISFGKPMEPFRMGSKPIKQILEELEENLEKIFGDDAEKKKL